MKSSILHFKPLLFLLSLLVSGSLAFGQSTETAIEKTTEIKQEAPVAAPSVMQAPKTQQQVVQQQAPAGSTSLEIVKITRDDFNAMSAERQQFILENPSTYIVLDVDDVRKVSIVTPERLSKMTEEQLKYMEEHPELFIIIK